MIAAEKFHIGDRVTLSAALREDAPDRRPSRAVVVGFGRIDPAYVRVRREGRQRVETYHADYWDVTGEAKAS